MGNGMLDVNGCDDRSINKRSVEWVVLTKAPVPGVVKTRLIPALGAQGACDIYEQLLVRLEGALRRVVSGPVQFQVTSQVPSQVSSQVAIWVAGDAAHDAFKSWSSFATFYSQPELGDLGARMALAVQSSLDRGCMPILIGVDVPDLDDAYLLNCLEAFITHDLVISPAEDGGYGLLGMKQFYSELFTGKAWGTDSVFEATRKNIEVLKINAGYLPRVWDVDEIADVERFRILES